MLGLLIDRCVRYALQISNDVVSDLDVV